MINNIITISIDARLSNQNSSKVQQANGHSAGEGAAGSLDAREGRNSWQDRVTLSRAESKHDQAALTHEQAYLAAGRNFRRGYFARPLGGHGDSGYGNHGALGGAFAAPLQPGRAYATPLAAGRAAAGELPANEFLALPMSDDSNEGANPGAENDPAGRNSASGSRDTRADGRPPVKGQDETGAHGRSSAKSRGKTGSGEEALTPEEKATVDELKARDREVRSHEQAHMGAAGGLAQGGATFDMTVGPDGKSYAVGGEVRIDTSTASTPEATISKARRVRASALAPAQPSGQDMQVAAQASQMEYKARQEKVEESREEDDGGDNDSEGQTHASGNSED